jgi:hypothetical protein
MKRVLAAAVLSLGLGLSFTTHASAQTTVRATVPFDFAVGERVLPHGTYLIGTDGSFTSFKTQEGKTSLFLVASPGVPTDGAPKLVFDDINGNYFLRDIVTDRTPTTSHFAVSKLEKELKESRRALNIYAETSSR